MSTNDVQEAAEKLLREHGTLSLARQQALHHSGTARQLGAEETADHWAAVYVDLANRPDTERHADKPPPRHTREEVLAAWKQRQAQKGAMGPRDDTRAVDPNATGMRALYPNTDVWDAMSFQEFMSVTEIAKVLGGTVKEVQEALKVLEKRGNLVTKGRTYRLG